MRGFVQVLHDDCDRKLRRDILVGAAGDGEVRVPSRVEVAVAAYLDRSGLDFDRIGPNDVTLLILDDLGATSDFVFGMACRFFQLGFVDDVLTYEVPKEVWSGKETTMLSAIVSATTPVLIVARDQQHLGEVLRTATDVRFAQVDQRLVDNVADIFWAGGEKVTVRDWEPNLSDVLVALRGSKTRADYYASIKTYQAYVEAPAKEEKPHVPTVKPLSEMHGFGEAQEWGMRLAADLKRYRDKELAWADMDVGVLLSSPPGGGKTTFARALAAECGVPFFPTTYTDWAGGKEASGDTISKQLTKLFAKWREAAKSNVGCIVFIDEIDSIGKRGIDWKQDYWFGPVINSWLAFLDGAVSRDGVVVIAATNYPDRVDDAMKRPGRLDRHLRIPMPDAAAIAGMLYHHLGSGLDEGEVRRTATALRGQNPAQIMQVTKDARRAARSQDRPVRAADVLDFLPPRDWDDRSDEIISVHEAGHVVAFLDVGEEVLAVDLDRTHTEVANRYIVDAADFRGGIVGLLAGRAAEEVVLGEIGVGCGMDLSMATHKARRFLFELGHGGIVSYAPEVPITTSMLAKLEAMLEEAYATTVAIIRRRRHDVVRLAATLRERRYLTSEEIGQVLRYRERFRAACEANYDAMDRYWGEAQACDPRQMAA